MAGGISLLQLNNCMVFFTKCIGHNSQLVLISVEMYYFTSDKVTIVAFCFLQISVI